MSADNWRQCPRCMDAARTKAQEYIDKVAEMYGKVPAAEYEAARAEVVNPDAAASAVPQTFREDYEFRGADEGVVHADYDGSCEACGLQARLRHEVEFYRPGVPS